MKIGITGHQNLDDPIWVKQEISLLLHSRSKSLIGVTSLAVGADQLFAQAVLDSAGALQVILPFDGYDELFDPDGRKEYERLLARTSMIEVLSAAASQEEAFFAAGKKIVDLVELVFAVWNGKPAAGLGGTADVVQYARSQGKPYIHINPTTRKIDLITPKQYKEKFRRS